MGGGGSGCRESHLIGVGPLLPDLGSEPDAGAEAEEGGPQMGRGLRGTCQRPWIWNRDRGVGVEGGEDKVVEL